MADVIGNEHGITNQQWADLAEKTKKLIPIITKEIEGYERHPKITRTTYGSLLTDSKIVGKVKKHVKDLKERCDNLVILGIGGSALGNIALQTALNPFMYNLDEKQRQGPRLFVFDNVDPSQFKSFLDWLGKGLDKTIFNVTTKSGRTAETLSQFMIIRQLLLDKTGPQGLRDQVVVNTRKKDSILHKIVTDSNLRNLELYNDVGGRFSVLSAVGLFSAAMCGIKIDDLLAGAKDMHKRTSCKDFEKNPAAINAAINYHYYNHGKRISVIMPYSYALKDFADWYRQLWAESLGKTHTLDGREVHIGPTPVKALGATDQHSQVQLYREGPNDKLFTFLQVNNFDKDIKIGEFPDCASELAFLAGKNLSTLLNNEKKATEYALLTDKRPCLTVLFDEVNAYTVGQFIHLFEVTTSFTGALFDIDTYNQEAVELGKEATFALMGKKGNYKPNYTYEQFAEDIRAKTNLDEDFLV